MIFLTESGEVYSGPAKDRDEAIKVGKEVTKNILWVYSESKDW